MITATTPPLSDRRPVMGRPVRTIRSSVLRKPIIVLGAPRSGTTLLSDILGVHRDVALLVEPRLIWRWGNDRRSDLLEPAHATEGVIAHIHDRFAQKVREQNKQRLVEKTPSNALRPGFVHAVFPDCRFVHITRHPADSVLAIRSFWEGAGGGLRPVAKGRIRQRLAELTPRQLPYYLIEAARRVMPSSMHGIVGRNLWGPRIPGIRALLREMDLLDVCCLQWRQCVEASTHYGRQLNPDQYFECRLEDLNEGLIRRILDFCELDADPTVLNHFRSRFDPGRLSGRRKKVDDATLARIESWTASTMRWLGY